MVQYNASSQKRLGLSLHGILIDLREPNSKPQAIDITSYPTISSLFNQQDDETISEIYLSLAIDGQIGDSEELYLIVRSLLRTRKQDETIEVMNSNIEAVYSNRKLMYEYIILMSKTGNYGAMNASITFLKKEYGLNGVHSKVLQALLTSRAPTSEIDEYIRGLFERFEHNAPYEILRASFNSKSWELALKYVNQMPSTPRNNHLALRTLFRLGEKKRAEKLLRKMKPQKYNQTQLLDIIRIGLQIMSEEEVGPWLDHSTLEPNEIKLELARSQYKNAITESDFESSFAAFKILYEVESFTPHQILVLIRTSNGDPKMPLQRLYQFGQAEPFLLSCVVELATKYRFKQLALTAFKRLEAMSYCTDRHSSIFEHYIRAAQSSADLNLMSRAYSTLSHQAYRGQQLSDYANYFDEIRHHLSNELHMSFDDEEELLEGQILRQILLEYIPEATYNPTEKHALIVNNSLKFGGAERQVVRCLSCNSFSKHLVVWNSTVNTTTNSFIDEVRALDVEILDYSLQREPLKAVYTPDIEHLLSLIPQTSPLNPGITNKIRNLIHIIRQHRPYALHLWQDTTNVLGAIAGLVAGVPRIVMSARSLPPFTNTDSTFPNKGPNYYLNNRYVRVLYKQLLSYDNVFLCHNSENGLEKYKEWLGGYEKKMLLLRNGFDFENTSMNHHSSLSKKTKTLGTVFRFVEVKRPLLWLNVASKVNEMMQEPVRFQMVGDGPMLETAISHAKALGLEDLVEFSGYRDDVNDILPTFDAFLLTSAIEGLPNVLIEAQSIGVPVISTNAGGAKETFIEGTTGMLVDSSNPHDIATAVCEVLQNQAFRDSSISSGVKFVHDRYSVETMHKQLHRILFEELK